MDFLTSAYTSLRSKLLGRTRAMIPDADAADVLKDANNATDIETEYKGDLPTYILFRTVRISPKNKNTYICYKVTPLEDEKYKVIVVWMTGDATIEELKAMFRK